MDGSSGWSGSTVRVQIDGRIAALSLNRPQKSNALSQLAFKELPKVNLIDATMLRNSETDCDRADPVWKKFSFEIHILISPIQPSL